MVGTVGAKKEGMRRASFGIDYVVGIKRVKGIRKEAYKHDSKIRISVCFRTRTSSSEFLIAFGAVFPGSGSKVKFMISFVRLFVFGDHRFFTVLKSVRECRVKERQHKDTAQM